MPSKLSKSEIDDIAMQNANVMNQQYESVHDAKKSKRGGMAYLKSHNICILRKGERDEWWFRLPREFKYSIGMRYDEIHEWLVQNNKPCSADVFYNQFLNPDRFSKSEIIRLNSTE
ncbi:MAG: hypothetical protein OCC49_07845 [Fibrobacterales bacterium]